MAFVLPSLTDWAEGHLSAILTSTTEADFDNAFDAFLSTNAHISVNGKQLSRDQYKQQLLGESAVNKESASVQFNGTVEVPTDAEQPVDAGLVGIFFVNTIILKFLVFGAHAESRVTSSLNVFIEQDKSLPQPPVSPIIGVFDGRRVTTLNQVFTEKPVPITRPGPPA
jgi:hypothetical protein